MNKDTLIFIKHILDAIEKIEDYTKSISKENFEKDIQLQDAIIRRIEIIGEVAKNIAPGFKNNYPFVKWKEIIQTRDKIIHHYFGVDLKIIWEIIKKDMPRLKQQMLKIKKTLERSNSNKTTLK